MDLDINVCKAIAIKYQLPLQFIIKEFHVFDILNQITISTQNKKIIFKGGTALNKVYFKKTQRFSEDFDFDSDSNQLEKFAKDLAANINYNISEFRKIKNTIQFYCLFDSPLGIKDHVRVDIASKKIITSKPPLKKPAVSEYTKQSVLGFKVYALEDLVARKMHALLTRTEGKDVFDVYCALPMCKDLSDAIDCMLKSENMSISCHDFVRKIINKLKNMDTKRMKELTNPFIPRQYRPANWDILRNDLCSKLERFI